MTLHRFARALVLPALFTIAVLAAGAYKPASGPKPYGLAKRVPWATSHVKGSPEPPLPFRAEMAFPHLAFDFPLDLVLAPGTNRWFVAQQFGKIYSFPNDP